MDTLFGWTFLGIAALFTVGLVPRLAGHFYPTRPGFAIRLAAPVIFGLLSVVCFAGFAVPAFYVVAATGIALIVVRRRTKSTSPVPPVRAG